MTDDDYVCNSKGSAGRVLAKAAQHMDAFRVLLLVSCRRRQ